MSIKKYHKEQTNIRWLKISRICRSIKQEHENKNGCNVYQTGYKWNANSGLGAKNHKISLWLKLVRPQKNETI